MLPSPRIARALAVGAALLVPLFAAAASAGDQPDSTEPAAKVTARATITAREGLAHVRFLASDELGGRDTCQEGQRVAARYIAAQFESMGLEPITEDGSYFQPFSLSSLTPTDASRVAWSGRRGKGGAAISNTTATPFPFSAEGTVEAPVVFCGYGITAEDEGYDDYAGVDVKGKIALVLRYAPREKDEGHYFSTQRGRRHAFFQSKFQNAVEHGAAGIMIVTGPLHHDADNFAYRWPTIGGGGGGRGRRGGGEQGEDDGALAVHIAQQTLDGMLSAAGLGIAELKRWQEQIDADVKPRSRAIDGLSVSLTVGMERKPAPTENVAAILRGTDPEARDEAIVIGAHYDHVGIGGAGPDRIHNGADDNASGTAGLLEIAQAFASSGEKPRRSIVFIAFSGEEKGLLGSRHYVREPIFPLEKTVCMINLDMIGRNHPDEVEVIGAFQNKDISDLVDRANESVGMKLERPESISGGSDHMPFLQSGVPAVFFFTGFHREYHQPGDHADKIVPIKLERVGRLAFNCAWELAMGDSWPERPAARTPRARRPQPEPEPKAEPAPKKRNPKAKVY